MISIIFTVSLFKSRLNNYNFFWNYCNLILFVWNVCTQQHSVRVLCVVSLRRSDRLGTGSCGMCYYGVHYYTSLLFKRLVRKVIIFGHSPPSRFVCLSVSPFPLPPHLFLSLPKHQKMKLVEETVFAEEIIHVMESD